MMASRFRTCWVGLLGSVLLTGCGSLFKSRPKELYLDHAIVAVRDYSAATARYERGFGFQVRTGPEVSEAVRMSTVELSDGTYLQLVQSEIKGEGKYYPEKSKHQGATFFALTTQNLPEMEKRLEGMGLRVEKNTVSTGGSTYKTARAATDSPLGLLRFVEYEGQRAPFHTQMTAHPNSAVRLSEVWIVVEDLDQAVEEFAQAGFGEAERTFMQPLRAIGRTLFINGSSLILVQRNHLEKPDTAHLKGYGTEIIGISFEINDINAADRAAKRSGQIRYATTRYNGKSCVLHAPQYAYGLWLELCEPPR